MELVLWLFVGVVAALAQGMGHPIDLGILVLFGLVLTENKKIVSANLSLSDLLGWIVAFLLAVQFGIPGAAAAVSVSAIVGVIFPILLVVGLWLAILLTRVVTNKIPALNASLPTLSGA